MNEEELLKKLRNAFKIESEERLKNFGKALVDIEQGQEPPQQMELLESAFRDIHSLKGAARSVNLKEIESICQSVS